MARAAYGGRQGDPRDIVKWWRAKTDQIEGASEEALQAFAKVGEESMVYRIATDQKTKASRARGGGRVKTGSMINDVSGGVTTSGAGRKTARFGWMGKQGQSGTMYYLYQEGGFRHWKSGEQIEGMRAQQDAAEDALQAFREAMNRGLRSA